MIKTKFPFYLKTNAFLSRIVDSDYSIVVSLESLPYINITSLIVLVLSYFLQGG